MVDQNNRSNILRDSVGSASLLKDCKLDPELTKISLEFIEAIDEIRKCPGCGKMRYLRNAFFCVRPECSEDS